MALSFKESIIVSFSDFWSRKLRSFITIFSLVLGTLSIVVVQSMTKGIKESTLEWMMERGGITRIDIKRNWQYNNPKNLNTYLTLAEFNTLKKMIPQAKAVSAEISTYGKLFFKDKSLGGSLVGCLPELILTDNWTVEKGRFFNDFDMTNKNDVIVIGSTVAEELFGNASPIGKVISFQESSFQVIGVLGKRHFQFHMSAHKGWNLLEYLNRSAFVPISTTINKLSVEDKISEVTVHAHSAEQSDELRYRINDILLNLRSNEPVFLVSSALESAKESEGVSKAFGIVMLVISLISLFVAGIVIMNIMMASIKERTREIGIRMSVGATRTDIFLQFMIQTLTFTLVGGVIGVLIGISLLNKFSVYIGLPLSSGVSTIVLAIVVSVSIGLIFGIAPAIRASNLDPVKCLAYE